MDVTNIFPQLNHHIKPIIRRKLDFWDPVDFKIKKIIKRNIALHEKARYAKDSIFAEKLINQTLTSRKWTKKVNLSFVELREKATGILHFLKRHKSLTHFNLTFQECLFLENLIPLAKALNCASSLVSIQTNFKYTPDIQEKGAFLHRFCFTLRKLPKLQENILRIGEHHQLAFSLDLIKYNFAEIPSFKQQELLTKNLIFRQEKRTTLMFDMRMQPELHTEDLRKLALIIPQNKKLKICQISLPKETVLLSIKKIQPLLDSFLHLPNLQILKLSLKISNQQPSFLSLQAFKLPSLQKIYLKIEYVQPTLKILKNKIQALSEIEKLYSLELDLSKSNLLTDENIKDLAQMIQKLPCLRKLSLKFQECKKITENGIVTLLKTLSAFLRKLHLDFSDCCSTEVQSKSDQFHQNSDNENIISNLEKLSLSFANCQEITRVTFALVQKLLLQAKNLRKLHLNFQGINKKLILALPIFHQSLNHLKHISDIHLIFKDCKTNSLDDTFNSKDLSQLGNFISHRHTLRKASLDILKCKNTPQQFFVNLIETLCLCETLRNLTLSANYTVDRDFLTAAEKFEMRSTGNYKLKLLKHPHGYETTDHSHDSFL